jgi:hypothetical protein
VPSSSPGTPHTAVKTKGRNWIVAPPLLRHRFPIFITVPDERRPVVAEDTAAFVAKIGQLLHSIDRWLRLQRAAV